MGFYEAEHFHDWCLHQANMPPPNYHIVCGHEYCRAVLSCRFLEKEEAEALLRELKGDK